MLIFSVYGTQPRHKVSTVLLGVTTLTLDKLDMLYKVTNVQVGHYQASPAVLGWLEMDCYLIPGDKTHFLLLVNNTLSGYFLCERGNTWYANSWCVVSSMESNTMNNHYLANCQIMWTAWCGIQYQIWYKLLLLCSHSLCTFAPMSSLIHRPSPNILVFLPSLTVHASDKKLGRS